MPQGVFCQKKKVRFNTYLAGLLYQSVSNSTTTTWRIFISRKINNIRITNLKSLVFFDRKTVGDFPTAKNCIKKRIMCRGRNLHEGGERIYKTDSSHWLTKCCDSSLNLLSLRSCCCLNLTSQA